MHSKTTKKRVNTEIKAERLDNNRGYGVQPIPQRLTEVEKIKETEKYFSQHKRRKFSKSVFTTLEHEKKAANPQKMFSHQYCGCTTSATHYPIKEKNGKYYIGNLAMCKNIHRCPSCMVKLLKIKETEIAHYVSEHLKLKKQIAFVTLTQKTDKSQTSKQFRAQIKKYFATFRKSRYFRTLKTNIITNIETTYSKSNNGHHHLHILLFFESIDKKFIESHKETFIQKWCNQTTGNKKAQDYQVLTPDNQNEKLIQYFSKSISQEMTNVFNKKGRKYESYNFLELSELGAKNEVQNIHFFGAQTKQESHKRIYAIMQSDIEATKGTQKINVSKIIKEKYPLLEITELQKLEEKLKENHTIDLSFLTMKMIIKNHITPHILVLCFENHHNKIERQIKVFQLILEFQENEEHIIIEDSETQNLIIINQKEISFY